MPDSQPIVAKSSQRSEHEPSVACEPGTVDSSLNEAPHLTPVYKSHAPVDHHDYGNEGDKDEHYSNVFHRDEPGRIVARFFGLNHSVDAKAYCDWCQTRDGQPG